ncbi:MAG: hypothetical protein MK110_12665 [Fuerstiella sp.]|nr:hypothetical protein [Fuerstiella sp.]
MTDHIDEFESIFRRAEKEQFSCVDIPVGRVTLVSDGSLDHAQIVKNDLCRFIGRLDAVKSWRLITGDDYHTAGELVALVDQQQTDLLVTHRHLKETSRVPQYSLGVYLDVLTQMTSIPVLVLPGTSAHPMRVADRDCNRVMVVADHISGDNRLINYGAAMCRAGGTMWLCHVEDDRVFERYMQAIARIPEIDSGDARNFIENQLLKEATDFIEVCSRVIHEEGPDIRVEPYVGRGHYLRDYCSLIRDHDIDLLVLNTKDDDQLAMHGRAYSLSVELTDVSMMLL